MKKKLTNNIGLKILSLLIAFGLWLVVINIEDPSSTQSFSSVPVTFVNADLLTDQGLVYDVLEGTGVIRNITVQGPRSVVEQLSAQDIVATADFNNLTNANTIPVEFSVNRFSDKITKIKGSVANVKLSVEKEKTIRLVLKVNATGEVADGFILGTMTPDQNQIIVTGAESVVDQISKAVAEVDVTDATANIATYADVVLLDSEGNKVESGSITQKVTSVRVSVEVLTTKRVPLEFATSGIPAEGYAVGETIDSNPSLVTIAGTTGTLNSISRIEIPAEEINVTGQRSDMNLNIDITNYLPGGVNLADEDFNGKVAVVVRIEPASSKMVLLHKENISLSEEIDGFDYSIEGINDRESVRLEGLDSNLTDISSEELFGVIDVSEALKDANLKEWKEGTFDVTIRLELPEGIQSDDGYNDLKAKLILKKAQ